MNTVVLKFGGSSVADNSKLNVVANKILEFREKFKSIVVVVSAQGKTTDKLVKESEELSKKTNKREYDALISIGEQISAAKLAILLEGRGYTAISLTGWQAGIKTSSNHSKAIIESIDTSRIEEELKKKKIVIVTGFQGIDEKGDITTLGRGGSDTSAVALAAALGACECNIFSDVEGIYSADPNKISDAKKLDKISYDEMLELSYEGAKVLHTRCVEIGKNFNVPILAKSTFNKNEGTIINNAQNRIESSMVKSMVNNNNIFLVTIFTQDLEKVLKILIENDISFDNLVSSREISFTINKKDLSLLQDILNDFKVTYKNISKLSLIGTGISGTSKTLQEVFNALDESISKIYKIEMNQTKIVIVFKELIEEEIIKKIHQKLI
mgnify:FL=1